MVAVTERIGVILVHGIGEQRRFEHLEGQGRLLIDALRRRQGAEVTVDILPAKGASYRSDQNTWGSSPSVRIGVKEAGKYREFLLHEVWWADVNEPYTIGKQVKFWLWGLSIWLYPRKDGSTSSGFRAMTDPIVPGLGLRRKIIVRWQLFGVSSLFLMAAFPLGLVVVLAKRLFNLQAPDFVQTIVNYVSGVKLYNQRRRYGASMFGSKESDFLDTMEEPPRVSVRRRMIEIMTDMALQKEPYARWYVLAHSLGSVVAFNGLMEPGEMLANYVGKDRWEDLVAKKFAGKRSDLPARSPEYFDSRPLPVQPGAQPAAPVTPPIPARPVWLDGDDIVYRHKLFANFKGVLTYGSPLEKFATIWPARVPINKTEQHFPKDSEWINIYDPIDPVSGVLRAYTLDGVNPRCTPTLINIGFSAHWALLYAHLRYLSLEDDGSKDLGDAIAHWMLDKRSFQVPARPRDRWYEPYEGKHRWRKWLSAFEWFGVYVGFGAVGAKFVPWAFWLLPNAVKSFLSPYWSAVVNWRDALVQPLGNFVPDVVQRCWMSIPAFIREWSVDTFWFIATCAVITLLVGIYAWLFVFKRDPDDIVKAVAKKSLRKASFQPEAAAFGLIGNPAATPGLRARLMTWIKGSKKKSGGK